MSGHGRKKINMSKTDAAKIEEVASAIKHGAQEFGRSMSARLDEVKSQSADGLHSGAEWVRTASENVAGKLDSASSYIGESNAGSLTHDVRRAVTRHPMGFLIVAAAVGFCAGTVISRFRMASKILKEELV
jgi:ElaB/YqjD/DUF883 family membrane-anchored ribosome-binding protein